jgi:2-polyprenyl-3-methyl-5-hydroxy-6-metoxy-1,4-benzoquinol methylase
MRGVLPDRGNLLDLGCGRGLLLALLVAARDHFMSGNWPEGWPWPPLQLKMQGIDLKEENIKIACQVLGLQARINHCDIRHAEFALCTVIVIFDVLLYLNAADQSRLLEKAVAALEPGGVLLIREADADAGFAFWVTRVAELLAGLSDGRGWQRLWYRRQTEWVQLLESLGLTVATLPMSEGTPFANVLFIARRRSDPGAICR